MRADWALRKGLFPPRLGSIYTNTSFSGRKQTMVCYLTISDFCRQPQTTIEPGRSMPRSPARGGRHTRSPRAGRGGSVRPASTASTLPPAATIVSSVPRPMVGTSNRMSCCGLATLTTVKPPARQSAPARRMHSSVPSTASTASTAWSLTATLWPMSSRPISLAIRQPKSMSFHCQADGPRRGELSLVHEQLRCVIGGRARSGSPRRQTPSTIVPSSVSSRQSLRRVRKCGRNMRMVRQVGQMSQPPPALEQPHLVDLADHRGFGHAVPAEVADGAAELGQPDPAEIVADLGQRRDRRVRSRPGSRLRSLGGAAPRRRPADKRPQPASMPTRAGARRMVRCGASMRIAIAGMPRAARCLVGDAIRGRTFAPASAIATPARRDSAGRCSAARASLARTTRSAAVDRRAAASSAVAAFRAAC